MGIHSFWEEFRIFCQFFYQLPIFYYYYYYYRSSLYIFWIRIHCSTHCTIKVFYYSVTCHFTLLGYVLMNRTFQFRCSQSNLSILYLNSIFFSKEYFIFSKVRWHSLVILHMLYCPTFYLYLQAICNWFLLMEWRKGCDWFFFLYGYPLILATFRQVCSALTT